MRILIFIVSYNAEKHIKNVLEKIPPEFKNSPHVQILIIDDASVDNTVQMAQEYAGEHGISNIRVLKNKINQGYGGNQKVGYRFAVEEKFDVVVMLHGDGQYTPQALPDLIRPFEEDKDTGCVLGSRFGRHYSPLKGGMPFYKFVGNRILSAIQNKLSGAQLSEWHTGYRAYSTHALRQICFDLNTNDFHFDTEIILQLLQSGQKIREINIPTRYGDEICHVNGLRYAKDVLKASLKFFLQKFNLAYDVRFHPEAIKDSGRENCPVAYRQKFESMSPHKLVTENPHLIPNHARVLDIGCSTGYVAERLIEEKNCTVTGIDFLPMEQVTPKLKRYEQFNIERDRDKLQTVLGREPFDVVLMLDIIEHLSTPEKTLLNLSTHPYQAAPRFICSTGNVAFFVIRLMLLLGHFNYGRKGILDVTHKRLFSVHTFRNILEQTGFLIQKEYYLPFPFRSLGFPPILAKLCEKINLFLIKIRPRLFAYQFLVEAWPLTTPLATLANTLKSEATVK